MHTIVSDSWHKQKANIIITLLIRVIINLKKSLLLFAKLTTNHNDNNEDYHYKRNNYNNKWISNYSDDNDELNDHSYANNDPVDSCSKL